MILCLYSVYIVVMLLLRSVHSWNFDALFQQIKKSGFG